MRLLDVVAFLKVNPRLPVKVIAQRFDCHPRNVQKFLARLEVVESRGRDPINGRANVKLYSIKLPDEKRRSVKHGA